METDKTIVTEELKRWTLLDTASDKIVDVTDQQFSEGIDNHMISLRGQFIRRDDKKIWIDGVVSH